MELDRHSLEQIAGGLGLAFYLLILGALFAVVTGSPGLALLFLVLAAAAHVGRWALEEFVAQQGDAARVELKAPDGFSQLRPPPGRRRTLLARRRR